MESEQSQHSRIDRQKSRNDGKLGDKLSRAIEICGRIGSSLQRFEREVRNFEFGVREIPRQVEGIKGQLRERDREAAEVTRVDLDISRGETKSFNRQNPRRQKSIQLEK